MHFHRGCLLPIQSTPAFKTRVTNFKQLESAASINHVVPSDITFEHHFHSFVFGPPSRVKPTTSKPHDLTSNQ